MAGFLPGYSGTLLSDASKKRYSDKLKLMDGLMKLPKMSGRMM